jgi:outer membrane protein assembly factor BamB
LLIAVSSSGADGAVVALALEDGAERWRAVPESMAYSSPQRFELLGQTMVLVNSARRLVGLDPATGAELWGAPWEVNNGLTCTQPVALGPDRVMMSSGYGKGAMAFELTRTENGIAVDAAWRSSRLKARFNNPVFYAGAVFGLDEGALACLDPETGKRLWKGESYGYGQLVATQGRLLVLSEDGDLIQLEASAEEPVELARFRALDGLASQTPALADGWLVVRSQAEMACYDLRSESPSGASDPR